MASVYLWCPAYRLSGPEAVSSARTRFQALCTRVGWRGVESPDLPVIGAPSTWSEPEGRRSDLARGWSHDFLLAARGGYGCIHLVDHLLGLEAPAPQVIGYSDLTVFHALWARRGWKEGFYGFMPGTRCGDRSLATTATLVSGGGTGFDPGTDPGVTALLQGTAEGPCFAACLRVLTSLIGGPAFPDLTGRILALEDIDERPYRVDRDLTQLHQAGCLKGIAGLVFGTFPASVPDGYQGPSTRDLGESWARRVGVPAVFGLPFGHVADPLTLANGRPTRLVVSAHGWFLEQVAKPV